MKVKFFTLGCKVNQYETQALMEEFSSSGHKITSAKADLYIINTCTVTHRADSKSREAILKAKKENPKARIGVCGCLTQLNKDFIKNLGVNYIIFQDNKAKVADIILDKSNNSKNIWSLKITKFFNHRAFVKIQDGCDNFCSFCKVPYLRGRSSSRSKEEVIEEIKRVSLSHSEIVLCGTNLASFGRDFNPPYALDKFIEEILKIESLVRLRLSSLEANLISDKLLSCFSQEKLCPHLHLPFQSGDEKILKAMNKKVSVSLYEDIVKKIRDITPCVAISCDIMVGFPGEDEGSFKNTVEFLKRIKPMRMHIFKFSPREKTPFFGMKIKNQTMVRKRYDFLRILAEEFSLEYKKKFLGKTLSMVAEEKKDGFICGYTENYIKVYIKEKVPLGEIIPVKIEKIENGKTLASIKN